MADHAEFNTVIDVEDHTGNLLPEDQRAEPSAAQQEGFDTAKANAKAEAKENTSKPNDSLTAADKNLTDAQELAKLNHKVDQENSTEGYTIAKNDTSKAGKRRTSKSQLDPNGKDPVSEAEVNRAATDGENVKGGTSVSNEDVAERAKNPGKAEEENPQSLAGDGVDEAHLTATDDAKHANGNENDTTGQGGIEATTGPANQS
jgi:hypothetical protein